METMRNEGEVLLLYNISVLTKLYLFDNNKETFHLFIINIIVVMTIIIIDNDNNKNKMCIEEEYEGVEEEVLDKI